ncbi:MAG TPA: YtxH domain-containing protein [Gammaproteobacteria bacterium]|nr:YtxH domain-containing protein [Gammaproteobacteria bacterium]
MRTFKYLVLGLIIGTAVGLWLGVNLGKGKPLLSNPFNGPTLRQSLEQSGTRLKDKSEQLFEQGKNAVQDQMNK